MLFITHGEVEIDPRIAVPEWPLSARGIARHERFSENAAVSNVTAIHSSDERKAKDGAQILGRKLGLTPQVAVDLHENDRSATGYLPSSEFEDMVHRFFAHPTEPVRGWESASDAQSRVTACVRNIVRRDRTPGDIAIVAHGGVGALLMCQVLGVPISRAYDQPGSGGGNFFVIDPVEWRLAQEWTDIAPGA